VSGARSGGESRGGPTVLRIVVGGQLRRLREVRGISRQTAGYAIRASEAKISRLELGRVSFKLRDVADLLTLYDSDPAQRELLLGLAEQASSPGWWHSYSEVLPHWFEMYVGLEQDASVIRCYEAQFVPGLFQTQAYARAVTRLGQLGSPTGDIELRVRLRLARQDLLTRAEPPTCGRWSTRPRSGAWSAARR
jgi:hypothetical protein